MPPTRPEPAVGLLLAGGQARRMGGGDKCLLPLAGRPMLAHAIERARPQVAALVLNANGEPARFAGFDLPVAADVVERFAGPLAGVLTGMEWAKRNRPEAVWLATFATDTPFFPADLVARMLGEAQAADVVFAASGGRTHPVFGIWRLALAPALRQALLVEDERKINRFAARHRVVEAAFPMRPFDPFFNVNRAEDLAEAERLAGVMA